MQLLNTNPTENPQVIMDQYNTNLSIAQMSKSLANIEWTVTPKYEGITFLDKDQQAELETIIDKMLENKTLRQQVELIFGQSGYSAQLDNIVLDDLKFGTKNGETMFQFQNPRVKPPVDEPLAVEVTEPVVETPATELPVEVTEVSTNA